MRARWKVPPAKGEVGGPARVRAQMWRFESEGRVMSQPGGGVVVRSESSCGGVSWGAIMGRKGGGTLVMRFWEDMVVG